MTIWLDAHLSPLLAAWLNWKFDVQAVRDLGLRDADDEEIFQAAKQAGVVVLTKDPDFPRLLDRFGPPPQVLWLTSGNTSNERLQQVLLPVLPAALELLAAGEPLVEIGNTLTWGYWQLGRFLHLPLLVQHRTGRHLARF